MVDSDPGGARLKVLYVAGWGRSGTTLMDNVLGAHDGVFTAGEITRLWELGYLEGRRCGCGDPVVGCAFWAPVLRRAFGDQPPDPRRLAALQHGSLGVLRTGALLAAARSGRSTDEATGYADILSRLYRAIAATTGCRVVVDASKRPPDAILTAMASGVEPYLLHMVRDPRACAYSWQRTVTDPSADGTRMHRHGRLMNVGHWVSWNVLIERLTQLLPPGRVLRVRYEDFMSAPRDVVGAVVDWLGEPVTDGPFLDDRTVDLPPNHTIAGNPGRFRTGEVGVRLDDAWVTEQGRLDRYVTTALASPWLRHYGYSWGRPTARSDVSLTAVSRADRPRGAGG
ncbi:sulfotransferase family protein [Actinomycetospora aeridis]|uniref:Sulfotransferase n=1 Tax=Actinomycetospora aeridis TaxID=3129231 RepID=A0ABU8NEG7_9PSEU